MVTTRSTARKTSSTMSPAPDNIPAAGAAATANPAPAVVLASQSPAGSALGIDPISKARTITHMNKDHSADMSALLRHYAGLDERAAAGAEMLDLDLATLTLRSASGVHTVPISPPMAAWSDRRARLVEMTAAARDALGLEVAAEQQQQQQQQQQAEGEKKEKKAAATAAPGAPGQPAPVRFYPPEGVGLVSFTGVLWYLVSAGFYFSGHLGPGSAFWRGLEAVHFPGGPETYIWLIKVILVPMVVCHVFEGLYVMANNRLAPRGVPAGSVMWLLWVGCTFLEGAPAWQRFDRRVLQKQKHQ